MRLLFSLATVLSFSSTVSSFLFGCGCQQPCAPGPVCAPAPICPPAPSCGGGGYVSQPAQFLPSLPAPPQYYGGGGGGYAATPQQSYVPVYQGAQAQAPVQQVTVQPQYSGPIAVEASPAPVNEQYGAAGTATVKVTEEEVEDSPPDVDLNLDPSQGAAAVKAVVVEERTGADEKSAEKEEKVVDIADLKLTDDPLCNSEDLRALMLENIDDNLNSSKRLIQLAAEAQFGGRFDVICANGDFSYVTNTELFCQESKGDVSCYTYRQL